MNTNSGNKRFFKQTAWLDKQENFILDSYLTRERDNVDRPRDLMLFKAAYIPLADSDMPAVICSFHLEYLHRSLNSRSKHDTMGIPGADAFCVHCNETATSTHVLNDCIIAHLSKKVLLDFFTLKKWTDNQEAARVLTEDMLHSFFWWDPKILDYKTYREI